MGPLWWYTSLAFVVSRLGDVVNIVIGTYLVPRVLSSDQLGALLPLMAVGALFSTPLGLVLIPVGKFLNVFMARGETGKCRALLQDALAVSALFTVVMAGYLFLKGDAVLVRLGVTDRRLLWPIAAFALLSCIDPVLSSALRALKLFYPMLLGGLTGPYIRLAGMLLLLAPLGALGYLLAQLGVGVWGTLITAVSVSMALRGMHRRASYRGHLREMCAYTLPLVALGFAMRIQGPIEAVVIRQRLPGLDSAGYYFAVTFGSIPSYITGAMAPFLWSVVSDRFERGESTRNLLVQSQLFNLVMGGGLTVLFALVMPWAFTLPGPWQAYAAYAGFVWQVSLMRTLRTALDYFTAHENACRRFGYMWYVTPMVLLEAGLLYVLPAWSVARPYLPVGLWQWVADRTQPSLQFFVSIMILANLAFVTGMVVQLALRHRLRRAREA